MEFTDRSILTKAPARPAGLVRISDDQYELERGVGRQTIDVKAKHGQLGWGGAMRVFTENDTSAYRRRRVTLPDGTRALRVIRPEFDALLAGILAGEIDGLIVYDLDRLVRQPRQLEDLIDAVESMCIPVHSYSAGHVNLLTSDGRAMARVMCAFALKASEDTGRRVARAAFESAKEGGVVRGGPRRFGWEVDGLTLCPPEAAAIVEMVRRATDGESVWSLCKWLHETGMHPVNHPRKNAGSGAGIFSRTAVNQLLRSPRLAGVRMYAGRGRGRAVKVNDWRNRVATKDGEYVMGPWQPVITVTEWEALQEALDSSSRPKRGGTTSIDGFNARKHLLVGLLRCGACGAKMMSSAGTKARPAAYYRCLPKHLGGCNGLSRNMELVDKHVTELLMRDLESRAIRGVGSDATAGEIAHARAEISRLEASKVSLREHWKLGRLSDDDYFADRDALAEQIATHTAAISARRLTGATEAIIANPREAWEAGSLSQRRIMLGRRLLSVKVMPQAKKGRFGWDPEEIVPSWR